MVNTVVEALVLDLLEWLAKSERSYEEVMDAWRTSCPRLPVWEDANDRGPVTQQEVNGRCVVTISVSGRALLEQYGLLDGALMAITRTSENRTTVRGLGEIALRVNNLDAMQQFYEEVSRWAISAKLRFSPSDSYSRPLILARRIRFSAARYSLRSSNSLSTLPVM